MSESVTVLTDELLYGLPQVGAPFVLPYMLDASDDYPTLSFISRVDAVNRSTLRSVRLDGCSRPTMYMASPYDDVSIAVFAPGTVQTNYGTAGLVPEALHEMPRKHAEFANEIAFICDAMLDGVRLSATPGLEKTYDQIAADKLDGQVFAAMRKA
ncbi:hypothetical protein [Paenibacillus sp. OV219]|uniref:hypothetical protein n=1 Tax=Paenibacillus sp. OV219 TaxID=1884377 RepID=UPI0008B66FDB|nr:hypothetical protein [Paenibacillus sp. OV219]SEN10823.1 hypothetical protein SAMN05518847_102181 [Paenibacillus sp. OV219]